MPRIHLETTVDAPPDIVCALSLSVDAHLASMERSGELAVAGVRAGSMSLHDTVTWRARHFGITFTMTSVISAIDAPARFVDEQVKGPFHRWRHEHLFHNRRDGGTLMIDNVDYVSPVGPLGRLVDRLFLESYMTALLQQRNHWLAASASGSDGADQLP